MTSAFVPALLSFFAILAVVRARGSRRPRVRAAKQPATVYLVGAGPGAPDLITVRGLALVERCDALLNDRLVAPQLVERARARGAIIVNVGKGSDKGRFKQESVEQELIQLAGELGAGKTIVRLKGGDPFVFGLGASEFLALQRAGVPCVVVPGLSSALAVPTHSLVPLTHKAASAGFIVVSGHAGCTGEEWSQLPRVPRPSLQLVVLMIAKNLPAITAHLLNTLCWDAALPCRLVQSGCTPTERQLASRLDTIASDAFAADMTEAPLILVVGESCAVLPTGLPAMLQPSPSPSIVWGEARR
jgi:uroporphyrin-III C-methyltransferase